MSDYAKPLPHVTQLTQPFWDAAKAGRLVVQQCGRCGHRQFPPSRFCDCCLSDDTAWVDASPLGTVWSACEFHRAYFKGFAPDLPYNVALVRLDDGPRMYTNLVGIDYDQVEVGMRVEAVFEPVTDIVTLVKFRPVAQPSDETEVAAHE